MNFQLEKLFGLFQGFSFFGGGGDHVLFGHFGFRGAIFGVIVAGFSVLMWDIFGELRVGLFSVQQIMIITCR